ncbi:Purine nucleoside phosphorylase [Fragariocoptes setiger]|uniref:Purine nucleoside phosphorylase n=1 Tax=Fragariocoptes setiger TaxID=1670756 RepID=A0ABQ7SAF3_9ACAR|nr:Purine nucleoside phosphorylase [Fragariocoptes setiger]
MADIMNEYDKVMAAVSFIEETIVNGLGRMNWPAIGVVCGSGLGQLAEHLDQPFRVAYADIPYFPVSTVIGHAGELVFGKANGVEIVCMKGRTHLYEGYDVIDCVRPVRVLAKLGIKVLIVTNAAGNLTREFIPGDIMVINDHISFPALCGENPLRGVHDPRLGPRFLPMTNAYSKQLVQGFLDCSEELQMAEFVRKGVYAMVSGPTFETVAEARMLSKFGANAVGMSTTHEVTVGHHMGVECIGISLITNDCALDYHVGDEIDHTQVLQVAEKRSTDFVRLVLRFIKKIGPVGLS